MKRSEINHYLKESIKFFQSMNFYLPKYAIWGPKDWVGKADLVKEIVDCGLGWDITDFGSHNFLEVGLINFNLRNGIPDVTKKNYCEKIIIVQENQITPLHTHRKKIEDIINRGGGDLVIQLYQADDQMKLTDLPVNVQIDSMTRTFAAGDEVVLSPGESITLEPGVFHKFYGKPGKGWVLVGEVSTVNDDKTDNVFLDGSPRFPLIEEDEDPLYFLVNDYPTNIITVMEHAKA
jgi:D-lyxose ketol-isomerase